MAAHARERGMSAIAEAYEEHAQESETRAKAVRGILVNDLPVHRLRASSNMLPRPEQRIAATEPIATEKD
jgi:rubrerythrin